MYRRAAFLLALFCSSLVMTGFAHVHATDAPPKSAWTFSFTSIDGRPMPLSEFRGQVLLVVNTASFCGYTQQYKALQALHEKYASKRFAVIGVPSNDFEQEPKNEAEIKGFCEGIFGVTFPLTGKNAVKGDAAHPFYKWARDEQGGATGPRWNFHKYLIGRNGKVIASFLSGVAPDSAQLISAIEAELAKEG